MAVIAGQVILNEVRNENLNFLVFFVMVNAALFICRKICNYHYLLLLLYVEVPNILIDMPPVIPYCCQKYCINCKQLTTFKSFSSSFYI